MDRNNATSKSKLARVNSVENRLAQNIHFLESKLRVS